MSNIHDRIRIARERLIRDSVFYGAQALMLDPIADSSIETFETDGTYFKYNPEFAETRTDKELITIWAHETSHCSLRHPWRIGTRDLQTANEAADQVVNNLLKDAGFTIPSDCPCDPAYKGMSFEEAYAKLYAEKQKQKDGQQPKGGQGPSTGSFSKAPKPENNQNDNKNKESQDKEKNQQPNQGQDNDNQQQPQQGQSKRQNSESDWICAAEQAANVAAKAGKLSADAKLALEKAKESRTAWQDILRRFIAQTIPCNYSWDTPDRSLMRRGLILPGIKEENCPKIAIVVDTSGSIAGDPKLLGLFEQEIKEIILECKPELVEVIYCDWDVKQVDTYDMNEQQDFKLKPVGGGGTAFQPAFDYLNAKDELPACCIYLTDLMGDDPTEPEYPVLWAVPEQYRYEGKFGETIKISMHN